MARASSGARRRLTPEQQREIVRMYRESDAPTADIRGVFGIGESSLYRVLQKHGVSLRGRAAPSTAGDATGATVARVRRGRPRRDASLASPLPVRDGTTAAASRDGARRQFRVRFEGQRVLDARDVRDALRQTEALGATEVIEVTRLG